MITFKSRRAVAIIMTCVILMILMSALYSEAQAAPPATVVMLRMRADDIFYDNSITPFPDEFMQGSTRHDNYVQWYYSKHKLPDAPAGENRPAALYCIEPSVDHIWDGGDYDVSTDPHPQASTVLTDKQKSLLSYVLTYGQRYYDGPQDDPGDESITEFSYYSSAYDSVRASLDNQIATQLAVWLIGANIYEPTDPERISMIGDIGSGVRGFAPTVAMAEAAQAMIDAALAAWDAVPYDFSGSSHGLDFNKSNNLYEVTIKNNVFTDTSPGSWGEAIINAIIAEGLTVTSHSTDADTIIVSSDTAFSGAKNITVTGSDGLRSPVLYIIYERPSGGWGQQMILADPAQLDTNSKISFTLGTSTTPVITTTATDQADGDKELKPGASVTILDAVKYQNLDTTLEYTLTGTLYDKATGNPLLVNGKIVTATIKFTPTAPSGTVNITFTFDARSIQGKTVVVFEKLSQNGFDIAAHEDINDLGQTVTVHTAPPKTGDSSNITSLLCLACISLCGAVLLTYRCKSRKED